MDELGFYYYISGLDILAKYMLHIPEQYPVIAFIEKAAKEEIYNNLLAEGFEVIEPQYTKKMYEDAMFSGSHNMQVILYTTEDFQYSSEGLASIEKAFADLYFAITRNGYPLSLQELVRIYQNLSRLGNIDKKKLITVASRRNIQYDIRFIVETKSYFIKRKHFREKPFRREWKNLGLKIWREWNCFYGILNYSCIFRKY